MYRYRAGIDIGSTTVKLVILNDRKLWRSCSPMPGSSPGSASCLPA